VRIKIAMKMSYYSLRRPWEKCCQERGISGCWECAEFEKCEKLDFLKNGHGDAHLKNLRIIKRKGPDGLLSGKKYWYSVIKNGSR
jgi:hypothetical protein